VLDADGKIGVGAGVDPGALPADEVVGVVILPNPVVRVADVLAARVAVLSLGVGDPGWAADLSSVEALEGTEVEAVVGWWVDEAGVLLVAVGVALGAVRLPTREHARRPHAPSCVYSLAHKAPLGPETHQVADALLV